MILTGAVPVVRKVRSCDFPESLVTFLDIQRLHLSRSWVYLSAVKMGISTSFLI